ncbi:TnsD family Tn7-like transposition protein [Clostridium perfringens]|nr:TnsD family Tn7-like transposition protein [Clostridium perfringens]MDK0664138.1 TnsD family Tn7-like transposition protein [Clostridium perfringens]
MKERRGKWLDLQKKHKNLSISELRKLNLSTYRWLLKYDKRWLRNNSPKKKRKGKNYNIDLVKRDEEIVKMCKVTVKEILPSKDKPQRVSIGLVGRKIGKQ